MKVEQKYLRLEFEKWKIDVKNCEVEVRIEGKEMPFTIFIRKGIQIYAVN